MRKMMTARPLLRALAVLAGMAASLSPVTVSAGVSVAAAAPPCVAVTGGPPPTASRLSGVTVLTACSAWAVTGVGMTAEQWDGEQWTAQQFPLPTGGTSGRINVITGLSTTSIWAAGRYAPVSGTLQPLIEHWNGSAWSVSPSPGLATDQVSVTGVAASSASDAWVVGDNVQGASTVALAERWDGKAWTRVPAVSPTTKTEPAAVADISATNAWMVGSDTDPATSVSTALIEHWDGTSWKVVTGPTLPANSALIGVSALSATDVWAVGLSGNQDALSSVIEHYDGTSWTLKASPVLIPNALSGVAVTSTGAIAVGYTNDPTNGLHTLMLRWDGTTWTRVPTPDPAPSSVFTAVDGTSNNYWGVGFSIGDNQRLSSFALHCC